MGTKVTFDAINKLILITLAPDADGIIYINFKVDIYSDAKEDWITDPLLNKLRFPIEAVGGQDTPGGTLGTTYFLDNDWKIRPFEGDQRLLLSGNVYSVDGTNIFTETIGTYRINTEVEVSSLVDTYQVPSANEIALEVQNVLVANFDNIAGDVWSEAIRTLTVSVGLTASQEAELLSINPNVTDNARNIKNTIISN